MNPLSQEQASILSHIKDGKNVVVDSCAGTGKTTLILSVAKALANKQLLQMTYNAMLRHEVKDRVKRSQIDNMKVHTFHSLAVKYYLPTAFTDTGLRYILLKDMPPTAKLPKFDVLVLDEAQDMTFIYFRFMAKYSRDAGSPIQLLILGDYMQGLYEFKGADIRFLTMADTIWSNFPFLRTQEFEKCTMKMSYRITKPMCSFVNNVMLGHDRMAACKDGEPVTYIRNTNPNMQKTIAFEILKLLDEGYLPSDIFVLGSSVKGVNIRKLENILSERGIPCHVPMLDNDKTDERVIDKKVVFSSFHCVKGRERKIVFILGFDNSYFKYFAKTLPKDICPNTLYVAATRSTERLYILERDDREGPLEFLHMKHIEMKQQEFIKFRGMHQTLFVDQETDKGSQLTTKQYLTPTELIRFIPDSVMEEISILLDTIFIRESRELCELDIPTIVETKNDLFEEVSDLNGIAIPCIYYDYLQGSSRNSNILLSVIEDQLETMKNGDHLYLKDIVKTLPENLDTPADYLFLANLSVAIQETLYFKLKQIDNYHWLKDSVLEECKTRLSNVIGPFTSETFIEETIIHSKSDPAHKLIDEYLSAHYDANTRFRFTGRVDLITDTTVWELKCTSKISIDHMLQVVIYAWLWQMHADALPTKQFKIFNIKTNELLSLNASQEDLNTIILSLLRGKYQKQQIKSNEEFINDCKNAFIPTPPRDPQEPVEQTSECTQKSWPTQQC